MFNQGMFMREPAITLCIVLGMFHRTSPFWRQLEKSAHIVPSWHLGHSGVLRHGPFLPQSTQRCDLVDFVSFSALRCFCRDPGPQHLRSVIRTKPYGILCICFLLPKARLPSAVRSAFPTGLFHPENDEIRVQFCDVTQKHTSSWIYHIFFSSLWTFIWLTTISLIVCPSRWIWVWEPAIPLLLMLFSCRCDCVTLFESFLVRSACSFSISSLMYWSSYVAFLIYTIDSRVSPSLPLSLASSLPSFFSSFLTSS